MRYPNLYERLVANTRIDGECWLWTGHVSRYPKLGVYRKGRRVTMYAHRLMLEIVTGYHFPFDEAGHFRCFNPMCIKPEHLRIETPAENLSTRRGYAPCEGRMIPVLFPTYERQLQDAADGAFDAPHVPGVFPDDLE